MDVYKGVLGRIMVFLIKPLFVVWFYLSAGQRKKWLLPIIILAAVGGVAVFMAAVRFGVKKKWTSSYELEKCKLGIY